MSSTLGSIQPPQADSGGGNLLKEESPLAQVASWPGTPANKVERRGEEGGQGSQAAVDTQAGSAPDQASHFQVSSQVGGGGATDVAAYPENALNRGEPPQDLVPLLTQTPNEENLIKQELVGAGVPPEKRPAKRSVKTEQAYLERVRQLYRWSERRRMSQTDPTDIVTISPLHVVRDFMASADSRGKSAFYLYRSALLWFLHPRITKAPDYATAYQELAATKIPHELISRGKRNTTRANKSSKKTIPEEDFNTLLNTLSANAVLTKSRAGCNWSAATQYWMHAGLAAGLRPNEWEHAYWSDETKTVLIAPTSKIKKAPPAFQRAGDGRTVYDEEPLEPNFSHESISGQPNLEAEMAKQESKMLGVPSQLPAQFRAIPIEQEDRFWIDMHLSSIAQAQREWGVDFPYYYDRCRKTLWRACGKAFNKKKNYSLYSLRGQFSADKKNVMPLEDVGKLMGHTDESYRTTMGNYGHRREGHKRFKADAHGQQQRTSEGGAATQHVTLPPAAPEGDQTS